MRISKILRPILISLLLLACNSDKDSIINQIQGSCMRGDDDYAYLKGYVHEPICTDSLCVAYLNIWKQILFEKNGITEDFFNDHITISNTHFNDWDQGTTFYVCYEVKIKWAIAPTCDYIPVRIKNNSSFFPSLPRDTYLTKNNINTTIGSTLSQICKIVNTDNLKFNSMNEAIDHLKHQGNISTLCPSYISIYPVTGEISLTCNSTIDSFKNECFFGNLELINGEATTGKTPCYITTF